MFKTCTAAGTRINARRRQALVGILEFGVNKESVSDLLDPLDPLGGYYALVT